MALTKFTKQPGDTQDYDIDYTKYLAGLSDTAPGPTGVAVTVDSGITLVSQSLVNGIVKVWLSGGTSGQTYKVTSTLTTVGGRVKEYEILVAVKES